MVAGSNPVSPTTVSPTKKAAVSCIIGVRINAPRVRLGGTLSRIVTSRVELCVGERGERFSGRRRWYFIPEAKRGETPPAERTETPLVSLDDLEAVVRSAFVSGLSVDVGTQ